MRLTNGCTLCQALVTIQLQHRELAKGALALEVALPPLIKRHALVLHITKGTICSGAMSSSTAMVTSPVQWSCH